MATDLTLLPQNVDAEEGVLGSCLIDPDVIAACFQELKPADFYRESHRILAQVILDMTLEGTPIDLITLTDELRRQGKLDELGGVAFVSRMANQVPTSANAEHYARIVLATSRLRKIIRIMGTGADLAYHGKEPEPVLNQLFNLLGGVMSGAIHGGFMDFGDVLDEALADVLETMQSEYRPGVEFGIPVLDRHTMGMRPGELVVVAARPGNFKSTIGGHIAVSEAFRQEEIAKATRKRNLDRKPGPDGELPPEELDTSGMVGWVTLEMSRIQQAKRVIAAAASIDTIQMRGGFRDPTGKIHQAGYAKMKASVELYQRAIGKRLKLLDTPTSMSRLRMHALQAKMQHNLKLLIIDQFDLMAAEEGDEYKRQEARERMEEYSRGLKELAKELDIVIVVLVQLNRESTKEARPSAHHLANTDRLTRDADMIIASYYKGSEDATSPAYEFLELNLLKCRDGGGGVCAAVRIEKRYTRISEWPESVAWPEDETRTLVALHDVTQDKKAGQVQRTQLDRLMDEERARVTPRQSAWQGWDERGESQESRGRDDEW